jgi:hypothetical protein
MTLFNFQQKRNEIVKAQEFYLKPKNPYKLMDDELLDDSTVHKIK